MRNAGLAVAFGAALMSACGGQDMPAKQLAESEAAIRAAEERNARAVPRAALHLTLAKEQMENAQKLIKRNEYERAHNLLARAQADAELALALAQSDDASRKAAQAVDKIEKLKQSTPNTSNTQTTPAPN